MAKINLDNAENIDIETHEGQICSLTFTLSEDASWHQSANIKVGPDYKYAAVKTYTVGDGLTIIGQDLIWSFSPTDWGNKNMIYDVFGIRLILGQRDWRGKIIVNKSF